MRTTVTLDDDVAEALKRRARERDAPFKRVLNDTIRAGLSRGTHAPQPYRMTPRNLGARPGINLTKALDLASDLEDAEILRKLDQRR